jgi:hypothetical protein
MEDIFSKSIELLKDVVYSEINEHKNFLHLKSVFKDAWYNFIVPSVPKKDFSWTDSEKVIEKEKQSGFRVSYYIPEKYLKEYKSPLKNKGLSKLGDDTFMALTMKGKFKRVEGEYVEVNEDNLNKYVSIAESCFPDFSTEREYCNYFYKLKSKNVDADRLVSNLLLKAGNRFVSFASVYASRRMNLAYLHNAGTLEKHRRKGYNASLVKYLCNLAFDKGITNIYSIVEEGGGSYISLSKLGFTPKAKFYLYAST